jgi:small subunit ribosomal protein S5
VAPLQGARPVVAATAVVADVAVPVVPRRPRTSSASSRSTAIAKGVEEAKKHFFRVPRIAATIPHPIQGEAAAGVVLLKPASPGTGVIAGGPVRAVLECAGIHDVLSKSLGSSNPINIVHATVAALKGLVRPEEIAAKRGLTLEEVAPAAMLRARAGVNT